MEKHTINMFDRSSTTRLPITLMRNRGQYQKSIERSVRLSSRGIKINTFSRI